MNGGYDIAYSPVTFGCYFSLQMYAVPFHEGYLFSSEKTCDIKC